MDMNILTDPDAHREWRVIRLTAVEIEERLRVSGSNHIECRFMLEAEMEKWDHSHRDALYFRAYRRDGKLKLKLVAVYGESYRRLAMKQGQEYVFPFDSIEGALNGESLEMSGLGTKERSHFYGLIAALLEIRAEEEEMLRALEIQRLEADIGVAAGENNVTHIDDARERKAAA